MKKGELGKLELSGFKSFKKCELQFGGEDYGLGDLWKKNLLGGRPG